jgi:ubiquilin
MAAKIKLTMRMNSGSALDVEIEPTATVKELKLVVQALSQDGAWPAEETRLIFKGKILKDENTLDEYKIENGVTVHMVRGKGGSSQANPSPSPSSSSSSSNPTSSNPSSGGGDSSNNQQQNPLGGFGGMGGFGGFGGFGGMGGGFPNMASGGGPSGMAGLGGMDPNQVS